jgi:hypothetical protein
MRRHATWLIGASIALAAAPAAAGTLDFWESSHGAQDVTASYPTGTAWTAQIRFDADSAEGGGLLFGASEIQIRPTGSIALGAFSCALQGCHADDYVFVPGTANDGAKLVVNDPDLDEKHGIYDLGTITFDGPQDPATMMLVDCSYATLDLQEHSCSPFVLVSLPEPACSTAFFASVALLAVLRGSRRH